MVRRESELVKETKAAPFGGVGEITVRSLLNGPDEMYQKNRVFGHTTVYPGSKIGYHVHQNDAEAYYILSGTAKLSDNGKEVILHAGDVAFTPEGEGHSLEAIGDEPVEMIALITYSK